MKKRIRLLLFDLDDTLWPCMPVVRAAEAELYRWLQQNVEELTRKYSLEALREHRIEFARRQPELAHDMSRVRTEAFRAVAQELGLGEEWIEPAFEVFLDARQRVTPYPDVIPVLKRLSGSYEIAAVTNGNADVYRSGLGRWFSFSVSAAVAGAQKPEPRMLEMALEKAGVDAGESVLIGDDEHRDIYGAARHGMWTVWVNREGRDWSHPACTADHHIRDLYELPRLLEHLEAQVGYNPRTGYVQKTADNSMIFKTDDVRIVGMHEVLPPEQLHNELPMDETASETVFRTRDSIHRILHGKDDRLVVIVGPCSVHDPDAAREYAGRLKLLIDELQGSLCIVMRVYFEKPRTTVGWKGLINDPEMDGSFHINKGLRLARNLLLDLAKSGVPAGTEFLDLISPQYIADLISWGAIGARTTESQGHRELASGLSCPIGFKNSTDGGFKIAIDAVNAASRPHVFMSLTKKGHSAIFSTLGNDDCHIILRGGNGKPNYDSDSIREAAEQLKASGLRPEMMIDCSHANSDKDYNRQADVCRDISNQLRNGETGIMGVMMESNLVEGRQDVLPGQPLTYGQSITDACMNWETTEALLRDLADAVETRRRVVGQKATA